MHTELLIKSLLANNNPQDRQFILREILRDLLTKEEILDSQIKINEINSRVADNELGKFSQTVQKRIEKVVEAKVSQETAKRGMRELQNDLFLIRRMLNANATGYAESAV